MLLVLILGGTAWGTSQYLNHVAFLGDSDGKVAVYQGVPGEILGVACSKLVEETDVSVADLSSTARGNIEEGLRCDSLDDAYDLVESYRADIEERAVAKTPSADAEKADSASVGSAASGSASAASGATGASATSTATGVSPTTGSTTAKTGGAQ